MKISYVFLYALLFVSAISCATPNHNGKGIEVRIAPNGMDTIYIYKNRLPDSSDFICEEKASVTPLLKAEGDLEIYKVITASGSIESRYEKVREVATKQLEFEAARTRACHEFGKGTISHDAYKKYITDILNIENKWIGSAH